MKGGVGSFYVHHQRPCPDPQCTVTRPLIKVCMSVNMVGVFSVAVHIEQLCRPLGEHIERKATLLAQLRIHASAC